MRLVFATHNQHKVAELAALLPSGIELISLDEAGISDEIVENGATLEDNALIKARYVHKRLGLPCFADDTGLEVEALGGAPGVRSARYAGEPVSHDRNIDKLLSQMQGVANRQARFRTVIALICKGQEYLFEGIVEGVITTTRQGSEGFGYDPVFLPNGFNRTFAQMSLERKNSISHRGRAVDKLIAFLSNKNC